ncbi:Ppx/GppA phosphatase family protein [Streptomyces sp. GDS52]|uniref:Ppx/GppA phosphatase N-terminal domain-containing protein n=1 Tax=Streptomyces cathayae TaxID=3031124 RepID=A0ABY8JWZ7_9ACTN|nr:hypothetical protein [Streptomyces sp. HUAS 5]WGD39085.1 hypothetical protein PYS65_02305 [Streptomyces sp. HUAS 5]
MNCSPGSRAPAEAPARPSAGSAPSAGPSPSASRRPSRPWTGWARAAGHRRKRPGAAAQGKAPRAGRRLALPQLRTSVSLLADAGPARRAKLPGISRHRAEQSLAGALIAQALMEACGARSVEICPWSTREGLLLERLGPPHITADRSRLAG